jgi:putative cardiolipin synthase
MKLGSWQSLRGGLIVLAVLTLGACAQLQARPDLAIEAAAPPGAESALDRATAPLEAQHPGQSAFRLVVDGQEAFVTRAHSARMASRSLDVQTYIWHADLTGAFLAHQLVQAADRGVRVRLLLDDMDARAKNAGFAAMAAHPKIEIRLFNPFASRSGVLRMLGEAMTSFDRINRRMHNKSWIADNRLAVVGGRNIGDEYFAASDDVNFVDLDFAMLGPVVREASASFDKYWNSAEAYPIGLLDQGSVSAEALGRLRTVLDTHAREAHASRYADALRGGDAVQRLVTGDWPLHWASAHQFVSDDPQKVTSSQRDAQTSRVGAALIARMRAARTDVAIISPYFVPGEAGTEALVAASAAGKQVRILTNSLAANDVAAVHGGYALYREPLLAGGVKLWELKPLPGTKVDSSLFGSSGASLHTKALAVDRTALFVGSYNLDPRSTWLNCEQGVLVENAALAAQLEAIFATQTAGTRAWQLRLEAGAMQWSDGSERFDSDPKASIGKRLQAWLARVFGLEAQL